MTDLSGMVAVAAQRANSASANTVLLAKPHATTHSAPYYRWSMWRNGISLECRINGNAVVTPGGWGTDDAVLMIDSPSGTLRAGAQSVTFTPVTLAYSNAVQARLFANSSVGELFNGRLYALAIVGRALSAGERNQLQSWAAAQMP